MGRFINGERPRTSPRLNVVRPARFDADHKELVNGLEKEEPAVIKEEKDDGDDALNKKLHDDSKKQPIRKSSRQRDRKKVDVSCGMMTRSLHKHKAQKQPAGFANQLPTKNGDSKNKSPPSENDQDGALSDNEQQKKPRTTKVQPSRTRHATSLGRNLRKRGPSRKKPIQKEERKLNVCVKRILRSNSKNR